MTAGREVKGKRGRDPDYWLTHRIWGYPIFLVFLYIMFQTTFVAGSYPMEWIEAGVDSLGTLAGNMIPPGSLHDLVVDGIIA